MGGRFVSADQLARLAREARQSERRSVEKLRTLARHEERLAAERHQRAANRHMETRTTPDAERRLEAKRTQDEWGRVLSRVERQLERRRRLPTAADVWDELEAVVGGTVEEITRISRRPFNRRYRREHVTFLDTFGVWVGYIMAEPGGELAPEDYAPEWEVGCEYSSWRGQSDVDVNIRVARTDGAPMPESEARQVFRQLRATGGEPPDGYRIAGVRWRNPKGASSAWRERGDPYDNLANLWSAVFAAQSARLGAVKLEDDEYDE